MLQLPFSLPWPLFILMPGTLAAAGLWSTVQGQANWQPLILEKKHPHFPHATCTLILQETRSRLKVC